MNSGPDKAKNLVEALKWMHRAVDQGAQVLALPECFSYIGKGTEAEKAHGGEAFDFCRAFAAEYGVSVLAGTIPTKATGGKLWNRSTFFGPDGQILAEYDKIHLFDPLIPALKHCRESRVFKAGKKLAGAVIGEVPCGMSVCYDLRFPELYRSLAFWGARVLFVPSAFTKHTGKAHWLALLRARAIENQAFVVAPAQIGRHVPGRESFGKACVFDPWGELLACAPDKPGVICVDLDFEKQDRVRREMPVLDHARMR